MSSFKLHSADSDFNTRVDALFNTLQTVAVDLEPQTPEKPEKRPQQDDDDFDNEDDDGQIHSGTIGQKFRKPDGFPPKWRGRGHAKHRTLGPRNNAPDYVKNPQNWTRYSMKETQVSSDRENKKIGLELFDELRSRKKDLVSEDDAPEEEDVCAKIVFKKPAKPAEEGQEMSQSKKMKTSHDDYFGGTKTFRMPEYQVGQSKPKGEPKGELKVTEKVETERGRTKDAVRLDYLTFEDDEEEDN